MIGIKMLNFEKTYKLPFKFHIPNYIIEFLVKQSLKKRNFKFLKRSLFILFRQQKNLEICRILPEHKKILWINVAASSIGDSLMDLSSRVLIQDRVVDLFTDTKNANLYKNDLVFDDPIYISRVEMLLNNGKKRKYLYFQSDYNIKTTTSDSSD